jgi:hypothetical protein
LRKVAGKSLFRGEKGERKKGKNEKEAHRRECLANPPLSQSYPSSAPSRTLSIDFERSKVDLTGSFPSNGMGVASAVLRSLLSRRHSCSRSVGRVQRESGEREEGEQGGRDEVWTLPFTRQLLTAVESQ